MVSEGERAYAIKMFTRRLSYLLERECMSQSQLAAYTGIAQSTISRYVNGVSLPNGAHLYSLCEALRCDTYDLLGF